MKYIQQLSSSPSKSESVLANAVIRLWMSLSQVDPRRAVKEQALLECIRVARSYRDVLVMDIGTVYAFYAIL